MSKKEDIELEIQDVVEEEKAASQEELESIKEQTKNTLQKIKENAKEEDPKFSSTLTLRVIWRAMTSICLSLMSTDCIR